MKKVLLITFSITLALFSGGALSRAQTDSLRTAGIPFCVRFSEGSAEYLPKGDFKAFLDTVNVSSVLRIGIAAYASPAGSSDANFGLSELRAKTLKDTLSTIFPGIPVEARGYGEDWTGLARMLTDYGGYDEALSVTVNTPLSIRDDHGNIVDGRKRRLMNLDGGKTWKALEKVYFPCLRRADILFTCRVPEWSIHIIDTTAAVTAEPQCALPSEQDRDAGSAHLSASDSSAVSGITDNTLGVAAVSLPEKVKRICFAPRTNLLLPATNIGLAVPVFRHFSVEADFYSLWLGYDRDNRNCFQAQAADAELRWWISPRHMDGFKGNTLLGHSLSIGAFGGHFDYEKDYHGTQGEIFGGYLGYAYAFPFFRALRLQLSIGFGYARIPYRDYTVRTAGGKLLLDEPYKVYSRDWYGPVKAGVQLVVPISFNVESKTSVRQ